MTKTVGIAWMEEIEGKSSLKWYHAVGEGRGRIGGVHKVFGRSGRDKAPV